MAWTSKIAILACALIVISCAFLLYDLNGNSLDLSDREMILVVSNSMDGEENRYEVDSFPANTLVMIEHVPDNELRFLRVGQVISYHDDAHLIHHRIVQVNDDSLYVRGDNGHSTDKVLFSDVNGVVVGTNSWVGQAVSWLYNNFLLFLCVMFVLFSIFIIIAVRSSNSEKGVI